jgi:saccharopine dehydrogenase (NAD+, L-lysine-forming)
MDKPILYIRSELNENEHRCPIVPNDVRKLIEAGYIIYIESSKNRVYEDKDYKNNGAIITDKKWYEKEFEGGLIIGIKEVSNLEMLKNHVHVYFSHSYKNQTNSRKILEAFNISGSIIYDFEYFLSDNKRIIGFGFYAGYVGCCLGLLQYFTKKEENKNIINLKPWKSKIDLLANIEKIYNKDIIIAVIGSNGICGRSVINLLDYLGINYIIFNKDNPKINLEHFDIVYNCIKLDIHLNETWLDKKTIFFKPITIVDISCDCTRENNPIKLYDKSTSWNQPVLSYNKYVDIIAIDNLPSLLPKDSSDYFSDICIKLLLNYNNDEWINNKNIFYYHSRNVNK